MRITSSYCLAGHHAQCGFSFCACRCHKED